MKAISLECGLQDEFNLQAGTAIMHSQLDEAGIEHRFELILIVGQDGRERPHLDYAGIDPKGKVLIIRLISVGQQAFVGLGAYSLFAATLIAGWNPLFGILAGGVVAALLALPTALLVFRLRGAYFAVGTWVVARSRC